MDIQRIRCISVISGKFEMVNFTEGEMASIMAQSAGWYHAQDRHYTLEGAIIPSHFARSNDGQRIIVAMRSKYSIYRPYGDNNRLFAKLVYNARTTGHCMIIVAIDEAERPIDAPPNMLILQSHSARFGASLLAAIEREKIAQLRKGI